MATEHENVAFVDRLEAYLLDHVGDLSAVREELSVRLEESRFLGNDETINTLEALNELLVASVKPDDTDVLPLIFALRGRGGSPDGHESPYDTFNVDEDHDESVFALDIAGDDRDLLAVTGEAAVLVRDAQRQGRGAYILEVDVAAEYAGAVVEKIESECAVVRSITTEGHIQVLVIADQPPAAEHVVLPVLPENQAGYQFRVRAVSYQDVLGSSSVARKWYSRVPALHVSPRFEMVERLLLLLDELEREQIAADSPLWRELRVAIDASLTVDLRSVFEEIQPAIEAIGIDLRKRVIVKVAGDTDRVSAAYAGLLRENAFELIVNAVQHGIEPTEERRAAGKPETGTIQILLWQKLGRLLIKIHDDGRGVDQKEIKRTFARHAAGGISRVRTVVAERFGGKLSLKTGDSGTTAEIDVPYRSGIYRGVVFLRDDVYYAAPATFVTETVELTPQAVVTDAADAPFVRIAGRVIPFIEAGSDQMISVLASPARYAVLLHFDGEDIAVAADKVILETQIIPLLDTPNQVEAEGIDAPVIRLPLQKG